MFAKWVARYPLVPARSIFTIEANSKLQPSPHNSYGKVRVKFIQTIGMCA